MAKLVYIINIIFPSTKFLDLLEIKIILNRFCLVKDLHIRYPFQLDGDTSDLTSHALDVKDFLKKNKSILF